MQDDRTHLPSEIADRFTRPFARFLRIEAASGLVLLFATLTALGLANSPWSAAYLSVWNTPVGLRFGSLDFSRSLQHWINDGLMTFFFFVVSLELKRELVLGELRDLRVMALPFAGALGGIVIPVSLYLALMAGHPGAHGWGTVMATDTAFVIGCLALFGSRIPGSLRLFLVSLAIFDDVAAIMVVAVGYGDVLNWTAIGFAILGLAAVAGSARLGIRGFPVYFMLGALIWLCFDASGIHATISGVILGLMTPTRAWVSDRRLRVILGRVLSYPKGEPWSGDPTDRHNLRRAGRAVSESLSPVERLEVMLHPWAGFLIMPVFALANAGVAISGVDIGNPLSVAVFAGLAFGKPVGVLMFSSIAVGLGLATRNVDLGWLFLAAGASLTGIGFTMSLFIANLAFSSEMLEMAKVGILAATVFSVAVSLLLLVLLTHRRARVDAAP